jgi:cobalt-zinc-cadmium efflux system outer membrane protein
MRMILWVAATVVVALPLAAQAPAAAPPRPLTLAEARAQARQASPEIVAAHQAVTAAAGRERQAGAWSNPTLAYGREQTSRAGETNSQDVLTIEQPFEIGGQRGARRRVAGLQREAAEARLAATEARVDFEVARAYATGVAAQRRAALSDEAAQAFGSARRVSQARLAGGDVSGYQHRRLLLEAARYGALRSEALVARDSALRALSLLIGGSGRQDSIGPLALVDTLTPAPLSLPADSLVASALRTRPDLRATQLEADAATANIRVAGAERIPTPVLTGGYKGEHLATGESLRGFVAGVSLPLPLWDRRGGATAAARAEAGRQGAELELARRQSIREVEDAYGSHQALAVQLAELEGQLGADARKARQAAEAAYAEGEISLLEWLDSVRAYQEAEATYATLWAEYIARRAALERATGATLF